METFYIDKVGHDADDKDDKTAVGDSDHGDDFTNNKNIDLFEDLPIKVNLKKKSKEKSPFNLNSTYLIASYKDLNSKNDFSNTNKIEKFVFQHGLEKRHFIPSEKSGRGLKLKRKKLREKTKGKEWFNMRAAEVTKEVKTDFELLKMRSVLDKKHVYKKNDITRMPKYFQVGKVIESSADFYGGRIPKSQRKKTMVEELLADAEFKKYQKKKYNEIIDRYKKKKKKKKVKKNLKQNNRTKKF